MNKELSKCLVILSLMLLAFLTSSVSALEKEKTITIKKEVVFKQQDVVIELKKEIQKIDDLNERMDKILQQE